MKRILAVTLVVIAAVGQTLAQQKPQHTQYVLNNYITNPAVGGIESYADLRTSFRSQWVGVEGAPETFYASLHAPLGKQSSGSPKARKPNAYGFSKRSSYKKTMPHHGVGAVVQVDKAGLLRASTLNGSYAYHLPVSSYFTVSSGISAGLTQYSVNVVEANPHDPNDPYLNMGSKLNATKLDLGLGMWVYTPDFYVGISGAQLVKSGSDIQGDEPNLSLQPHFYATAGLRFQPSQDLALIPSVMVKTTTTSSPAIDVNLRALYNQQVWGGVSYRHTDAWAAMAGVNLNYMFDLSYAYEMATSGMNQVTVGTHEVVLGIKLNNRRKVICPQFMW